ncbi:hypothetical protein [Aurantibacter sp.]|uniref:hypothetical protein n=1 Tax=Aurantibacter sp. TaxID=2807103 RepID=UPI0035C7BC08
MNPAIDFGDVFNKSIELFKKSWTHGLVLQLISMVIVLPIIIIMYVPIIMAAIESENGQLDPEVMSGMFAGFTVVSFLLFFVGILVISVVAQALQAGFFRILKRLDYNEPVKTSDLFYFLKGQYLGHIISIMLASLVISIIALLLCVLPLYYAVVPMSFFTLFFAFNPELSVSEIVKLSFSIGTKKWLITFGLVIVASLLSSFVGFLMCGIGILITAQFTYHPIYFIYKEVIGFEDNEPLDEIGK